MQQAQASAGVSPSAGQLGLTLTPQHAGRVDHRISFWGLMNLLNPV